MDAFAELFSFKGRINRARFIWPVVLNMVVAEAAILLFGATTLPTPAVLLVAFVGFAVSWATLAATVKRLHDLDRPGWHVLLLIIPIYGLVLGIILLAVKGTTGDNRYGPDPFA